MDGLGKLPPQALEYEEAVLGAVMLEPGCYDRVKDIILPNHFYVDAHKEIFTAIVDLKKALQPVDVRTVAAQLKKTGKLELVGQMYYLVALTAKVVRTDTIENDCYFIKEQALRREIIQAASRFQSEAYEDTKDVFELLEELKGQIEDIKSTSITEPIEAKIKALWKEVLLEEEPDPETPILYIGDTVIGTAGNHSLVTGKKKSRKTLFLVQMIAWYLKLPGVNPKSLIFFDTEQGKSHVWKILTKVQKMTGKKIAVVYLRGRSPQERRDIIEWTLLHWGTPVRLCFIDGIRDCLSNINDIDEVTETIVWLEKLTLKHQVHVCNVLHLNKGDNNARGHLGTELANKAQTSVMLELDEKNNCTKVICESSRDKGFEPFAFTHSAEELPEVVGMPTPEGVIIPEDEHHNLRLIFEDGPLKYGDFIEQIRNYFKCSERSAKQKVTNWRKKGWVVKSGAENSKDTNWSLITSTFPDNNIPPDVQAGRGKLIPLPKEEPPYIQENLFDTEATEDIPF